MRAAAAKWICDCRVCALSPITSGPNVRGSRGSRCRPASCWYRDTPVLLTRLSRAVTTSTRPDQFSGVTVHSIAARCRSAMLTKRRLTRVVSRSARSRNRKVRDTVAVATSYSCRYSRCCTLSRRNGSSSSMRSVSRSQFGRLTRSSLRTARPPMMVVSRL